MEKIEIEVARLDGYLTGIAALNGKINDYYAGAFHLYIDKDNTLESVISDYFKPNCKIYLSNKTEISWRELEIDIQEFIIKNIFDNQLELIQPTILSARRKYISFKVMDVIYFLIAKDKHENSLEDKITIYKLTARFEDTASSFTFFCILFCEEVLVLQFMEPINE